MSLVRWLNDSGVPTVTGARWSTVALRGVLTNPRHVGDLTQGVYEGPADKRKRVGTVVIGKAAWEPILDRTTFETVQGIIAGRQPPRGRPATASLLGGIVRCGLCLTPMSAHSSGRTSKPYLTYRCPPNDGGCGKVSRKRSLVDEYVVCELLGHVDIEALAAERKRAAEEVARLEKVGRDLTWRSEEVRTAIQEDRLVMEDALPLLDSLRKRRQANGRALTAARERLAVAERSTAPREHWDSWTMDQKRSWIRSHTKAIFAQPIGRGRRNVVGVEIQERKTLAVKFVP
jgi:hypothetical protein